ncbi:nucleoside 2-deoxyribosyltransferase, partial [Pseudomonas viridiflava]
DLKCAARIRLQTAKHIQVDQYGSAFEVGLAVALNKPVWAYFEPVTSLRELVPHDEHGFDRDGFMVEDFDLPRNLMLACSWAGTSSTVELGAEALARYLSGFEVMPGE